MNQPAVYATFEEDILSLRRNMVKFDMDFQALEDQKKVRLLDLEALEGRGMGSNLETILSAIDEVKAKRLVIDSLTAFLSGASGKFDYSFLMHLIYKTLKREGITTIMTVAVIDVLEIVGVDHQKRAVDGVFLGANLGQIGVYQGGEGAPVQHRGQTVGRRIDGQPFVGDRQLA